MTRKGIVNVKKDAQEVLCNLYREFLHRGDHDLLAHLLGSILICAGAAHIGARPLSLKRGKAGSQEKNRGKYWGLSNIDLITCISPKPGIGMYHEAYNGYRI